MKPIIISRRVVLGGLLASPLASLSGCGGGGNNGNSSSSGSSTGTLDSTVAAANDVPVAGSVKPVVVYYMYDGDTVANVNKDLSTAPQNVTTAPDRFNQGALCYSFAGAGSQVIVSGEATFPNRDFAIFLWSLTSSATPLTLLRLIGVDGGVAIIESNDQGLVSITLNGTTVAQVSGSTVAPSSPTWQHLAIQQLGNQLQIFVDGILVSASTLAGGPLPQFAQIIVGSGWEGEIDDVRLYNRGFAASSIPQSVYQWTQVKPLSMFDNLAAYFPFYGNTLNELGLPDPGVPFNVTPTTDRWGAPNSAYLFNGASAYIELPVPYDSTTGDFGISFWAQSSSAAVMTAFSATSGGVAGAALDLVFNSGCALAVAINGAVVSDLATGTVGDLTDGQWHYILLQRSGSTMQLFVDGALAVSADNAALLFGGNSVFKLGSGSGTSATVTNFWNGALDDVQLFESPSLSAEKVAAAGALQFLPRDGVGPLTFNGKLWQLGGWNPIMQPVTDSEIWSSVDGVNWTFETNAPWEGRHDAGYAVLNNRMWLVGGDKNTGHYQNDVWSSPDGINWELMTNDVPWANRATQYVLAFNDRLWLMGGQQIFEPAGQEVAYNDVYSSADGVNWVLETPHAAWSPRGIIMNNVVFQGLMWLIGGGTYDIRTFNNDVWSSPDGINWTQVLANAPWSPRQFHNTIVFDNKIWVFAGGDAQSQGGLNDVWYSPDGKTWVELLNTPWVTRHAASAYVNNNYLWFTCGSNAQAYNDVWKLGYAP